MRVTLVPSVNPRSWFEEDKPINEIAMPLGVLSLAAVLEQLGHSVHVVDFTPCLIAADVPSSGAFYAETTRRILETEPDVVGFSSMCSSYHVALRMAGALKQAAPRLPILFGGPHASMAARETLEAFPFVDVVVRGEAEQTVGPLLDEIRRGVRTYRTPGLTWRDEAAAIRSTPDPPLLPDLDSLPAPALHLADSDLATSITLEGGRGCPYRCSFCSTSTFWRRRYRLKSTGRLIADIRARAKAHGEKVAFTILHDMFTADRKKVVEFCALLKAEALSCTWSCSARVDCVDDDLLAAMSAAGCTAVFFGVESGSPRMQRVIRKNLDVARVLPTVRAAVRHGIEPTLSFIAGFADETEDDLRLTLALIEALLAERGVTVQLHLLGPERGTPDFERWRDRLRFDGYFSDLNGSAQVLREDAWFRQYPEIFASFHYYESPQLPRDLLRGLDLFVNAACSVLPQTCLRILRDGTSLFDLYRAWRRFADGQAIGGGPSAGQKIDEYLLDVYAFVCQLAEAGLTGLDPGTTRDEILAFLISYYSGQPVDMLSQANMEEIRRAGVALEA